jgi:hypothetical protein
MKIYYMLFPAITICFACNNAPKSVIQKETTTRKSIDTLKTLDDIKLVLLDARNEKAELLLGKPDVRGQIMMGNFYYMIYYRKVNDKGQSKHLVLLVNGKNGINANSPIYKIIAVTNGETIQQAGNFAQWLKVTRGNLTSNAMQFSYGAGSLNWSDVEASGTGEIKLINNTNSNSQIITTVRDLPVPSEAIKPGGIKKYIAKGLTGREIYVWYAEHYHAQIKDNPDTQHKYLGIPFNPNDTCILLKMTGSIDGSIQLEFSFECG